MRKTFAGAALVALSFALAACSSGGGPSAAAPGLADGLSSKCAMTVTPASTGPAVVAPDVTITASMTTTIGHITVAYFDSSGTEITSALIGVGQTLATGQSWTAPAGDSGTILQSNATKCQVVSWSPQ